MKYALDPDHFTAAFQKHNVSPHSTSLTDAASVADFPKSAGWGESVDQSLTNGQISLEDYQFAEKEDLGKNLPLSILILLIYDPVSLISFMRSSIRAGTT